MKSIALVNLQIVEVPSIPFAFLTDSAGGLFDARSRWLQIHPVYVRPVGKLRLVLPARSLQTIYNNNGEPIRTHEYLAGRIIRPQTA